jgi:hypothetical protein
VATVAALTSSSLMGSSATSSLSATMRYPWATILDVEQSLRERTERGLEHAVRSIKVIPTPDA